ncbi:hypothetical protein [Gelidibacter maritimus]|uniref:Uncharacterized protein n=1 Tax=Gelidibacter maritimus TaxID=2761487 RepID=A0A7W2M7R0_9FLAO|nr:hypothetical protein [Gelidibacter maritimus]MBA6154056.1 hypothetical protein [Gelidibacter maritimus]
MGHLQKIILLVLIVPLALFPGGLISYVLLFEELKFEASMWIPIGITVLGIGSFMFHFKTKKFYKLLRMKVVLPNVDPWLWVLDIAFGIAYILLSFYFVYIMYTFSADKNINVLLMVAIPMFVAGAWTVFEAIYLNKLIGIHKYAHRHSEIEDIKGNVTE